MLCAARLFLWTIIAGGASCFCIITFMRPTTWYATNQDFVYIRNNMTLAFPGDVPVLTTTTTKPDGTVAVVPVGKDSPLWAGSTAFPVTLQWGSVMMCALAVAGLQALAYWPASGPKRTGVLSGTKPSALASAWRLVRRMGATQIPPYRFWSWWCDGLSVFDAMIASVWLGLAVIYLYYNITRKFAQTGASLTPPPSPPPVPPPPPPSPIDLSLLFNGTANGTGLNGTSVNGTSVNGTSTKAPAAAKAAKVVDLLSPLFMSMRLEESAHSFGETLRGLLMVMFIPIARSNFLKHIFATDFPTIIKYHRWMSWGTLIIAFTHGFLYMIQWGSNASFQEELSWDTERGRRNVCGLIASIFAVLITFTSTSWFRATYYHLFHRVHLFSGATFLIFGMMHYKALANWIYPGLVLYMIDRFGFRMWQMMRNWTRVGPKDVHIDGNMVTMRFSWQAVEGRTIAPGQTVYVRCPSASLFQSHPFSVADVVHGEDGSAHAVVHMVAQGPWTRAVCTKLAAGETLSMQVEGPYTTQLDHYAPSSAHVIMVAGGQGITPLLGLLRHYVSLLAGGAEPTTTVPRVHLLWSSRSLGPIKLLGQDLLQACCRAAAGDKSAWLSASLHYTGFELEEQGQSINLPVARKASAGSDEAHSEDHHSSSEDAVATVGGGAAANAVVGGNSAPLRAAPAANPLVYALCTLLGFFGAWAGLLTAAYYDAYMSRTQSTGPNYLAVGILQFTCILFGAALPTLAVLAINDVLSRRAAAPAMERQLSGDSEDAAASQAGKATTTTSSPLSSATASLQVLPGYVLAPLRGGAVDGASSKALVRGRPDVPVVLARMAQEQAGQGVDEMDVLVAGHDSLVEDVLRACAEHNLRRAAGVPSLRCKRVAFHS